MKTLIVGAGAVGGFLAARLADSGDDVAVLVRQARAETLRREGLRLVEGSTTHTSHAGVLTKQELTPEFDLVVFAVKSDAIDQAIDDAAPAVGSSTAVVPFLNGIRHVDRLVARFGSAVLGGVLRIATELDEDGAIGVLARLFEVEIGELASPSGERVEEIASRFRAAGAEVTVPADILDAMWEKWVFIASIGAVTSLMRAPIGEIVAAPGGASFARAVLSEAATTAAAEHHPISSASRDVTEQILTAPSSPTTSSLSRDLLAGRPTEVEPVLGDLVAKAEATGTPAPLLALTTLALRVHNNRLTAASMTGAP